MLKTIRGLILGLVVLVDSAYVSPTYASSASIIISHVQAASTFGALDEVVVLYNPTPLPVIISDWCLVNKSGVEFFCFPGSNQQVVTTLQAYSHVGIASDIVSIIRDADTMPYLYTPTHATSGSLVGSSDKVTLYDADGTLVNYMSWTQAAPSGQLRMRQFTQDEAGVRTYIDSGESADWLLSAIGEYPESNVSEFALVVLPDDEDPADDEELPDDGEDSQPSTPPLLILSELLPNPDGSDTGAEYIELYNAGDELIDVSTFSLKVGQNLEKNITLPNVQLASGGYLVLTNAEVSFTLLNSSSRVALVYNQAIVEEVTYESPASGAAWASIDSVWQYTSTPTPGLLNQHAPTDETVEEVEGSTGTEETSTLKPCAANQYRHPETNRCRLIEATTSTLMPCREGQERNPETNRCRSVLAATDEPTPCKEGQERNPETGRCRNIQQITDAPLAIEKTKTVSQQQWYLWAAIGAIVSAGLAYAVWEWRVELREQLRRAFARVRK